jgi:hypothetical protein
LFGSQSTSRPGDYSEQAFLGTVPEDRAPQGAVTWARGDDSRRKALLGNNEARPVAEYAARTARDLEATALCPQPLYKAAEEESSRRTLAAVRRVMRRAVREFCYGVFMMISFLSVVLFFGVAIAWIVVFYWCPNLAKAMAPF